MIEHHELREVNRKLSLLIWMNVISIVLLVGGLVTIIHYKTGWIVALVVLVGIVHLGITIYLHIKLKKHTHLR